MIILNILAVTNGELIAAVFGVIFSFASLVTFILKKANKNKTLKDTEELIENSERLSSPCRIQVFSDSSQESDRIRKWQYAFSLNNGGKTACL